MRWVVTKARPARKAHSEDIVVPPARLYAPRET